MALYTQSLFMSNPTIICSGCGCEFPAMLGKYGCPNCCGDLVLTPPEPRQVRKVDERYGLFRERIFAAYKWRFNSSPRWGVMEGNNLHLFLSENPEITEQEFSLALRNLLVSDDVPERQRPGYWLPKLDSYLNHPHNTYGRKPDVAANAAERYLAAKNGSDRGLPAESKSAVTGQSLVERKRLRGVG